MSDDLALRPGVQLGPFHLDRRIAIGGMAEVWAARGRLNDGPEQRLALKIMRATFADDPEFQSMFADEVSLTKQLRHEHIIVVHGGYKLDGHFMQAMELIDGLDLRRVLGRLQKKRWRFPVPLLVHVGRCLARALAYAHLKKGGKGQALDIIHRDVSPHNIMLGFDGQVKVLDFGIAKAKKRSTITKLGVVKGKTGYMSPEQVIAGPLDHRTDIFSAGVVLWEAFTGERLFRGASDVETMTLVSRCDVPRLEGLRRDIPPEVADLVHRMLALHPRDRPGSMLEVERVFERVLARGYELEEHGSEALSAWLEAVARERRSEGTAVLSPVPPADATVPDGPSWPESDGSAS